LHYSPNQFRRIIGWSRHIDDQRKTSFSGTNNQN
jgi:hypothetical protein